MSVELRVLYVAGGILLLSALWLAATVAAGHSSAFEPTCHHPAAGSCRSTH